MNKEPKQLTQKELKESLIKGFALYDMYVDKVRFRTDIDENDKPQLTGADVTFKEGSVDRIPGRVYSYPQGDICVMLNRQFCEEGVTACRAPGVFDIDFEMGTRNVSGALIPVFKGCTAMVEEYEGPLNMDDKPVMKSLADIRREEMVQSLSQLDNEDIMRMVNAHFEIHPTLPGEKSLKTMAIDELANDGFLSDEQRQDMIQKFAQTCIRETKIDSMYETPIDLSLLKAEPMEQNGTVSRSKVDVNLLDLRPTMPYVVVEYERPDSNIWVGRLPDKFLTNNPMNVRSCKAELQMTDYSNGNLKNVSMRLVVDTDLMSGNEVNLDEDMLKGIEGNDMDFADAVAAVSEPDNGLSQ